MRPWVLSFALTTAACAAGARDLPPVDAVTAVVLAGRGPRIAVVAAYARDVDALPLAPLDGPIHALYYRAPLPWGPGTYPEGSGVWARPLSPAAQAYVGAWDTDVWDPVEPSAVPPFSFAEESPIDCAARGGCFVDTEATTCTVPCPAPTEPTLPTHPHAPQQGPCPDGWIDDGAICRAYAGAIGACAVEMNRGAGGACATVGAPCGGEWPSGLDEARTVFVRPGAAGGDGTRAAPLATLMEALARVPAAPIVALSAGEHAAPPRLDVAVQVIGSCAAQTRLTSGGALGLGGGVHVEGLTLVTPALSIASSATLVGVVRAGAVQVAAGGALTARDSSIGGTIDVDSTGALALVAARVSGDARAVGATGSSSVSIDRSWLEGALTATATPVRIARSVVVGGGARARVAISGGTLELSQVVLAGAGSSPALSTTGAATVRSSGLVLAPSTGGLRFAAGADVALVDTLADDTPSAVPLIVGEATTLVVRRLRVGTGYASVVRLDNVSSPVELEDVDSPNTTAEALDLRAPAMDLRRLRLSGELVLRLARVTDASRIYAVEIEDLWATAGTFRVREAGRVRMARVHLEGMLGSALVVDNAPATPRVDAVDLTIEGTRIRDCPQRLCVTGAGAVVEGGGLDVSRFVFRDNDGPAVLINTHDDPVRLVDGRVEAQGVAFALEVEQTLLRALLQRVTLVGVRSVCERCGR